MASSCNAPRYRATPSASTFASATTGFINSESFENCGTFPICYSKNKNYTSECTNNYNVKDIYNATYYDNNCDTINRKNSSLLLPKFDSSALHFVKTLGTSASGFGRVNLCRMDADRLVTIIDYRADSMSSNAACAKKEICREIDSISRLRHYNILHIIGTISSKNSNENTSISCYITEFMPNGDLRQFLISRKGSIKYVVFLFNFSFF